MKLLAITKHINGNKTKKIISTKKPFKSEMGTTTIIKRSIFTKDNSPSDTLKLSGYGNVFVDNVPVKVEAKTFKDTWDQCHIKTRGVKQVDISNILQANANSTKGKVAIQGTQNLTTAHNNKGPVIIHSCLSDVEANHNQKNVSLVANKGDAKGAFNQKDCNILFNDGIGVGRFNGKNNVKKNGNNVIVDQKTALAEIVEKGLNEFTKIFKKPASQGEETAIKTRDELLEITPEESEEINKTVAKVKQFMSQAYDKIPKTGKTKQ